MSGPPGTDKSKKQSLNRQGKLFQNVDFAKHLAAGTASGWLTGVVFRHAGKGVALVLGGGIILHQIAHHQGYIKEDLNSLKQLAQKKTNELSKSTPAINKIKIFATKNKVFTAGFCGGFLIGIAF